MENIYELAKKYSLYIIVGAMVFIASYNVASYLSNSDNSWLGATFQPSGISVNIREGLVAGASRTGATLNIDPMITLDGHRITMSDIGVIGYGKIDQGTPNEEIISFAGMTDNTSYYTLTGVNWGYNFYNNSTSTSNYKKHNSGAKFIISTDWHFFDANYPSKTSANTISGLWTFANTVIPRLSSYIAPTLDTEFVAKKYVDDIAISGSPDATFSIKGIIQLASRSEVALGTIFGSTGASLVLPSSMATSTSQVATTSIIVSNPNGKLDPTFVNGSETYNYTNLQIGGYAQNGLGLSTITTGSTTSGNLYHYHPNVCAVGYVEQAINATGTVTLAHGLGVIPTYYSIETSALPLGSDNSWSYSVGKATSSDAGQFVAYQAMVGSTNTYQRGLTTGSISKMVNSSGTIKFLASISSATATSSAFLITTNANEGSPRSITWTICK